MKKLQLTGQKFGRLLVIKPAANQGKHTFWLCECVCGLQKEVNTDALTRGLSKSCGCLAHEQTRMRSTTHGHTINRVASTEYKSWSHAKARCFCITDPKYYLYGKRGITMCPAWVSSFKQFLADMGPKPLGYTLDRINVNGNYEAANCRWASTKTQANNTRQNIQVSYRGKLVTLKELAELFNISYSGLHAAIRYRGKPPIKTAKKMAKRLFTR